MDNKFYLRLKAKDIRKNLDLSILSQKLVKLVRDNEFYKDAQNIMIFYPMKYEVNLLDLLNDEKNFYLPKVFKNDILVCPFCLGDRLEISDFKVKEPCSNPINPEKLDLVIVPALMVDKLNYRLGYGGGFYDRFLGKYKSIKTILPISERLIVEKLPHDSFDIPVDIVLKC